MPAKKTSKKSAASSTRTGTKASAKKSAAARTASAKGSTKKAASTKKATSKKAPPAVLLPGDISIPSSGVLPPGGIALVPNVKVVNMIPRSRSGEHEQDSEPTLAVNPSNTKEMAASAFTPDPGGGPNAPIFVSIDGGTTWALKSTVPSNTITGDITLAYSGKASNLYTGILKRPGNLLLNVLFANNPTGSNVMTNLVSRSQIDQPYVQAGKVGFKERVYVGDNDLGLHSSRPGGNGRTASIEFSLDAGGSVMVFQTARIEKRSTGSAGQNGPQTRPAVHSSGVVYAAFYGWRAFSNTGQVTADVVVVRDDNGGTGANAFTALVDPVDNIAGNRVVKGIKFIFNDSIGQQRLGGDIAIAVDPNNSKIVYIAWADLQPNTGYTLHVRRSTDSGRTWSPHDLLTKSRATNPGLAINSSSKVALLYQQVTGTGASQRWVTKVERSTDGVNWNSLILATVPAMSPAPQFQPYIGDYDHLLAVGLDFYGIFSANNTPDLANFPCGISYQRNHNFNTHTLLGNNGTSVVPTSIDPFFFKITELFDEHHL